MTDHGERLPYTGDPELDISRGWAEQPRRTPGDLLTVAKEVYDEFLNGRIYEDHDASTALLGRLADAITGEESVEPDPWPYIPGPSAIEDENACGEQHRFNAYSRVFTCTREAGHEGAHQGELWWREEAR